MININIFKKMYTTYIISIIKNENIMPMIVDIMYIYVYHSNNSLWAILNQHYT